MSKKTPQINNVSMTGQLVSNPRIINSGQHVKYIEFLVACNKRFKTLSGEAREKSVFISVRAWGRLGDDCLSRLCRLSTIYLEGELESAPKEYGGKINIRANKIDFLDEGVVHADRDSTVG